MKVYKYPIKDTWDAICIRPADDNTQVMETVKRVFSEVEAEGDLAIQRFNEKFDKNESSLFKIELSEILDSTSKLSDELKSSIKLAINNIKSFHTAQRQENLQVEVMPGIQCSQIAKPIDRVGIYIPGGTAPLLSTVLMLGIPAQVAGCEQIILCTPADKDGKVNPAILFAASEVGISEIYGVGGAQAIAALHYGTDQIPKVDKIFGPGNQYVTAAKQFAQMQGTAIDMPAGPSELLVLAGESSIPDFVAADLLSQAEHGVDSQVVCVVENESLIVEIEKSIEKQVADLPRKEIAQQALENSSFVVLKSIQERIDFINLYAPEHYIICSDQEQEYLDGLTNAGSVFLGNYAPESAGDYASGTNHTLPTSGFAKAYSGVNLAAFTKQITVQKLSETGIRNIGNAVIEMANAESLKAHANAVQVRLDYLNKQERDV